MQFNYDSELDEFVPNPTCSELLPNVTGNRVIVTQSSPLRFKIEIDDYGYVVGAMNRLMQRLTPTFVFPETIKIGDSQ